MTPRGNRKLGVASGHPGRRQVAVAQEVAQALAALDPVLVEAGDGQGVRDIDLVDERRMVGDDGLHLGELLGVDGRVGVEIDGTGHAADDEVRVRVLAAEDGVQPGRVALPGERLQVVGDRHQVGLGRQLVGRVAPVAVGEDAELAGLHEALDALLDVGEIAGRGLGPTC